MQQYYRPICIVSRTAKKMFENTERTVIFSNIDIEMEKGKGPGKRQILPFKTLYKIMAAAACLLLFGVSAAVIKPSLVKEPSKIPVEVPTENETIIQAGDYKVTAKGNKSDEFSVFLWTDGTYAYSIHADKPLKNADICAFVYEIEKK